MVLFIKAEARAEFAERSVQKLQKEVDRLEGEFFVQVYLLVCFNFYLFFLINLRINMLFHNKPILTDDLLVEKEKNKMLADEMEATLHDIQNM